MPNSAVPVPATVASRSPGMASSMVQVAVSGDATVGELAVPVRAVAPDFPVTSADRLLRLDPSLPGLVVDLPDGPALLGRAALQEQLTGRLGYGRAVNQRRTVAELVRTGSLVMESDLPLGAAAQLVLGRAEQSRYDDALVRFPDRVGLLIVSLVFEQLALHFAHHSAHDPLTGLPNRMLLADRIRMLPSPTLVPDDASPALLYIDLDGFKHVNDDHGHDAGDRVLVQMAARLRATVRPNDVVARLGGDEFAVLLVDPVTAEHAGAIADRVVLAASAPFVLDEAVVTVGASVGVAQAHDGSPRVRHTVEVLLRTADAAMYRAKTRGRGRAELIGSVSEIDGEVEQRTAQRELERRLAAALDREALSLSYQAKYELRTGRLLEYEALARWPDPAGAVSPAVFIPAAESSGLIHQLGTWALTSACREAAGWSGAVPDEPPLVAVNVSPHQLTASDFVEQVAGILAATGLPPERLCLEITESAAISDLPATLEQARQLRALGVSIALDDFGTGHSSLTLLRTLPLDWVKIDRSFVTDVAEDPASAVLVRLVIEAAHSLGVRVCAEGIEREPQLHELAAMGCDAVQGFLLGLPTEAAHLVIDGAPPPALRHGSGQHVGALVSGRGELVTLSSPEQRLTYVSAQSLTMLGYHPAEMTGTSVWDYIWPADRDAVRALRRDPGPEPLVHRLRHRDGHDVWVEALVRKVIDPATGAPKQYVTTAADVTARVTAQRAAAEREQQMSAAFDAAPLAMALTATDGRHLRVNAAYCALVGRAQAELLDRTWQSVTHPDDVDVDQQLLSSCLRGERSSYTLRKRYLQRAGGHVVCDLQVRLLRDGQGAPAYAVAHMQVV